MLGRFGLYQAALIVLIGGCMIGYAAIWRISASETLTSMFAMAAAASLALLALRLAYNVSNVIAVFNPLEKMLTFADANTLDAANGSNLAGILLLLLDGLASVFARYTFVLHSSPRPTVFLTWLIVPGIVYGVAARRQAPRSRRCTSAGSGRDRHARRTTGAEIRIFHLYRSPDRPLRRRTARRLNELRFHRWTYPVAMVLFGLHIAVGQAEPIKYAFMRRGPQPICEWNGHYMPLLPLPWCSPGWRGHNGLLRSGRATASAMSSGFGRV